jgi:hypothetical protein
MTIARLESDGRLDATFGAGGVAILLAGQLDAIAVSPVDRRIVAGGHAGSGAGASFALVRVLP